MGIFSGQCCRISLVTLDNTDDERYPEPDGSIRSVLAVRGRIAKQRISIMLDAPIIARYKAIAGERGYQTLINDTLRRAVEGDHFVQEMRNAIREELVEYAIGIKRGKSQQ
jgi:uncharacterized protein (DUF4415 family)